MVTRCAQFILVWFVALLGLGPWEVADAVSPEALLFIANQYDTNGTSNCSNHFNQTICDMARGCLWNASNNASGTGAVHNGTCEYQTQLPIVNSTGTAVIAKSWCYNYFPEWFSSTLYFLAMLMVGFSIAGLGYHYKYYDVYVTIIDGERLYNKYYFQTSHMNAFLASVVAVSLALFLSVLVYFQNPDACAYVPMTGIFLVVCVGAPFIGACLYLGWYLWEKYHKKILFVDIEQFIRPTTKEALPKYNNQVRCF